MLLLVQGLDVLLSDSTSSKCTSFTLWQQATIVITAFSGTSSLAKGGL